MSAQCTDAQYIQNHIRHRERGYIWLERELKKNLLISTAAIAVFFIVILYFTKLPILHRVLLFSLALLLNGVWNYLIYRTEYLNYQSVYRYLEEFELGNYRYQGDGKFMELGINSQLTEQAYADGRVV